MLCILLACVLILCATYLALVLLAQGWLLVSLGWEVSLHSHNLQTFIAGLLGKRLEGKLWLILFLFVFGCKRINVFGKPSFSRDEMLDFVIFLF